MVGVDPIVGKGTERRPALSSKATEMGLEWLLEARDCAPGKDLQPLVETQEKPDPPPSPHPTPATT